VHLALDCSELKRTLYTANFVFVFKANVPNEPIPTNPLGPAVTYFREDDAYQRTLIGDDRPLVRFLR
jgi:type IV secretory pathway component VirB8